MSNLGFDLGVIPSIDRSGLDFFQLLEEIKPRTPDGPARQRG